MVLPLSFHGWIHSTGGVDVLPDVLPSEQALAALDTLKDLTRVSTSTLRTIIGDIRLCEGSEARLGSSCFKLNILRQRGKVLGYSSNLGTYSPFYST